MLNKKKMYENKCKRNENQQVSQNYNKSWEQHRKQIIHGENLFT